MTVAKLISILQTCDPEAVVIMSSDPEGNSYRRLDVVEHTSTLAYSDRWMQLGHSHLTPDLLAKGYGKADIVKDGVKAVALWPED